MRIAIVGYGRMGKQIEKILLEKKITIGAIIDKYTQDAQFNKVNSQSLSGINVAIDFSGPDDIIENIKAYIDNKTSVVMGTTGWFNMMDKVRELVGDKIGFIWSGNFSIGVHVFFRIIRKSAKIFNNFKEYDPMLYEIHHNQKKDSPSGTAKMIGNILLEELSDKDKGIEEKLDRKINENEIHFASIRGGNVPGTHVVMFDSAEDTIELKHTARNREGFAKGAIMAAEWIKDKKGFFSIDDFMNSII
ncbi:MAG: 4-hydroxy-tetrahydrodipicolinate reductase [Spirochaetes bacterium]|nr:4-hydroxy-tetrahydrodipicolinate reductase [Spirochaetota bacterium]